MKKKFFIVWLAIMASVMMANASVYSGSCGAEGDNVVWQLNTDNGVLTINGSGAMADYNYNTYDAPWQPYKSYMTSVIINYGVTTIGTYAFQQCTSIKTVSIPNSVTILGHGAFKSCHNLIHVTIPESVARLTNGGTTFQHCTSMQSVIWNATSCVLEQHGSGSYYPPFLNLSNISTFIFGEKVKVIPRALCYGLSGLTSIELPETVTEIGPTAFKNCTGLTTFVCKAVTPPALDENVFASVNQSSCKLYVPYKSIGAYKSADQWKDFTNILPIPGTEPCLFASGTCGGDLTWELTCDSVLTIKGTGMMYEYSDWNSPWRPYKDSIKSVIIEEGVTTISTAAFRDHGHLQSCILPSTIESIGNEAFCFCFQLMYIEIPPSCTSFGDGSFNLVPNVIIQDESLLPYSGSARSLNGYVEGYFVYADESKKSLRACSSAAKGEITLDDAIERIEYMAFAQCEDITRINFGSNLKYIGEWSLNGCRGLEGLRFQEGLEEIAFAAFGNCFGLRYVYLPNSLITVGDFAIGNCPDLHTVHLGESLANVGMQFLDYCQSIDTIYAPMLTPPFLDNTVLQSSNIPNIICYVPSESLSLYHQAPVWKDMNLQPIETQDPCVAISGTCGAEGNNLTWELSCEGVLTISGAGEMYNYGYQGASDFIFAPWYEYRESILKVNIEEGVTSIGRCAFQDCTGMIEATIPSSVTYIGDLAFIVGETFTDLYISDLSAWCNINFDGQPHEGCNPLFFAKNFYINGAKVVDVVIPETITSISNCAFFAGFASEESAIHSITFESATPPTIGDYYTFGDNIDLFVPCGALEIYQSAENWSIYKDRIQYAPSPYTITITTLGNGRVQKEESSACETIIEAIPDEDYRFVQWSDGVTDNPRTIVLTSDTIITAIFAINNFHVVLLNYNGEILSEQYVMYDMPAIEPEVPEREGYIFSGWSADIEHIVAPTYAIALYDKIGGTLTYLSEEGDVIATENVDLHLPEAPSIEGKSFKGWLTESADSENGIALRATYTIDHPTVHDNVDITPFINSAAVIFPFITGALTYQLVIRDLFGNVVCKIMFSATGHLLGVAFAPSRNRTNQQATQTTGFNFTVTGLDANTTYEYEFVANDETDEVIETLSGSFTTKAEIPTGIDNQPSEVTNRKYLDSGHLLIDTNARTYDAQGKRVR